MSRLTLLGTVHRDPQGFIRLVEILEDLKPDIITLEFSIYGLHYRQLHRRSLRQQLIKGLHEILKPQSLRGRKCKDLFKTSGIAGIIAFLNLPFEYRGARFYSQRHKRPLLFLDLSSWSHTFLGNVDELISSSNLKKVIAFETRLLQEVIEEEYSFAINLLRYESKTYCLRFMATDRSWEERDRIIAKSIRTLLIASPGNSVVHICGWHHLVASDGSLYSHLKDIMPQRILLKNPSYIFTATLSL